MCGATADAASTTSHTAHCTAAALDRSRHRRKASAEQTAVLQLLQYAMLLLPQPNSTPFSSSSSPNPHQTHEQGVSRLLAAPSAVQCRRHNLPTAHATAFYPTAALRVHSRHMKMATSEYTVLRALLPNHHLGWRYCWPLSPLLLLCCGPQ
jgi:hypothetical protein